MQSLSSQKMGKLSISTLLSQPLASLSMTHKAILEDQSDSVSFSRIIPKPECEMQEGICYFKL